MKYQYRKTNLRTDEPDAPWDGTLQGEHDSVESAAKDVPPYGLSIGLDTYDAVAFDLKDSAGKVTTIRHEVKVIHEYDEYSEEYGDFFPIGMVAAVENARTQCGLYDSDDDGCKSCGSASNCELQTSPTLENVRKYCSICGSWSKKECEHTYPDCPLLPFRMEA
jgi:hypothetical protein